MNNILDWFCIILAIAVIICALITGHATVLGVVCGWLCAIIEKLTNMSIKKELNKK